MKRIEEPLAMLFRGMREGIAKAIDRDAALRVVVEVDGRIRIVVWWVHELDTRIKLGMGYR